MNLIFPEPDQVACEKSDFTSCLMHNQSSVWDTKTLLWDPYSLRGVVFLTDVSGFSATYTF